MTHELKCWPDAFNEISAGRKRHEIRKNDRPFRIGDSLYLCEWDPVTKCYTGRFTWVYVSYVSFGGAFGLPSDLVAMSVILEDTCAFIASVSGEEAQDAALLGNTWNTVREAEENRTGTEQVFRISFSAQGSSASLASAPLPQHHGGPTR